MAKLRDLSQDLPLRPVSQLGHTHHTLQTHTRPWGTPSARVAITTVLSADSCRVMLLLPGTTKGPTLGRGNQASGMLQKVTTRLSEAACLMTVMVLDPQEVQVHGQFMCS